MKIGILGGGQLGRMLAQEAIGWNLDLMFLDKSYDFPLPRVYPGFTVGDFKDFDDVMKFGSDKDILSIEIEAVNTEALKKLAEKGVKVFPQPSVIELIKDKGDQKGFYKENDIPTSPYLLASDKAEIISWIQSGKLAIPFVQKARRDGYDGKGVVVIRSEEDADQLMDVPSIIEHCVDIDKEFALIVGRNESGQTTCFPLTEMVFDKRGNLLDYLICPAIASDEQVAMCRSIALDIITKLDMVGILAVEFFLDKNGEIIVNEVAPRPHNSGHHTIDAGTNSQYNIHLRTLLNLPLPDQVTQQGYALMWNLLGEQDQTGAVRYEGLDYIYKMDQVYVHLYGKAVTKPLRKMGHVNVLGGTKEEILEKLDQIKSNLKATI